MWSESLDDGARSTNASTGTTLSSTQVIFFCVIGLAVLALIMLLVIVGLRRRRSQRASASAKNKAGLDLKIETGLPDSQNNPPQLFTCLDDRILSKNPAGAAGFVMFQTVAVLETDFSSQLRLPPVVNVEFAGTQLCIECGHQRETLRIPYNCIRRYAWADSACYLEVGSVGHVLLLDEMLAREDEIIPAPASDKPLSQAHERDKRTVWTPGTRWTPPVLFEILDRVILEPASFGVYGSDQVLFQQTMSVHPTQFSTSAKLPHVVDVEVCPDEIRLLRSSTHTVLFSVPYDFVRQYSWEATSCTIILGAGNQLILDENSRTFDDFMKAWPFQITTSPSGQTTLDLPNHPCTSPREGAESVSVSSPMARPPAPQLLPPPINADATVRMSPTKVPKAARPPTQMTRVKDRIAARRQQGGVTVTIGNPAYDQIEGSNIIAPTETEEPFDLTDLPTQSLKEKLGERRAALKLRHVSGPMEPESEKPLAGVTMSHEYNTSTEI